MGFFIAEPLYYRTIVLNGSNPNSTRERGAVPRLRVGLGLDGMDITGSKALPWNPLPSRLSLPNRQTIEFRLHSKARQSLRTRKNEPQLAMLLVLEAVNHFDEVFAHFGYDVFGAGGFDEDQRTVL